MEISEEQRRMDAEARLAALGKEASGGLPRGLLLTIALVIAVPLVIMFVPDVGARLKGANLRYRFKDGATFSHRGTLEVTLTGPLASDGSNLPTTATLENLLFTLDSIFQISDTDSGGNATIKKGYTGFTVEDRSGSPRTVEVTSDEFSTWGGSWEMGGKGAIISMMNTTAQSMKSNMDNTKRQNILRQEIVNRYRDQAAGGYSGSGEPAAEDYQDPDVVLINSLTKADALPMDMGTAFLYPREAIKPGTEWRQPLVITLKTKIVAAGHGQEVGFRLTGYKRQAGGFYALVSWDEPVNLSGAINGGSAAGPLRNANIQGRFSGSAGVNYATGVVDWADGLIDLVIIASPEQSDALRQTMNLAPEAGPLLLRLSGRQKFLRT